MLSITDTKDYTLNDSITLLKQAVVSENKTDQSAKIKPNLKCCEICTVKPKSIKSFPMTRCSTTKTKVSQSVYGYAHHAMEFQKVYTTA